MILKWFTPDSGAWRPKGPMYEDVAWTAEGCKVAGEWPSSPKVIRNLIIFHNKHENGEVANGQWLETQRSWVQDLEIVLFLGVLMN